MNTIFFGCFVSLTIQSAFANYDASTKQDLDFTDPFYKTQAGINLKNNYVKNLQAIYTGKKAGASESFEDPFYRKSTGSNTASLYDFVYNNYNPFKYRHSERLKDLPIPAVLPGRLHKFIDPFQGSRDKLPDILPASLQRFLDPYGRVGGIKKKGILEGRLQNVPDPYHNNAGGIRTKNLRDEYFPDSRDPFYETGGFRPANPSVNSQGFVDPFFRGTGGTLSQQLGNTEVAYDRNRLLPGVTYVGNTDTDDRSQYEINGFNPSWDKWVEDSSFQGNGDDILSWYRKAAENIYYPEDVQSHSVDDKVTQEAADDENKAKTVKVIKKVEQKVPISKPTEKTVKAEKVTKKGKKSYK